MKLLLLVLLAAASCSSSEATIEEARFVDYTLFLPEGWSSSKDLSLRGKPMLEWSPADNERKETLSIRRVDRPAIAKAGPTKIAELLVTAQRGLPRSTFGAPATFVTRSGLVGVRIEGDFVPAGQTERYRRLSATLIDGIHLIHLSYTARDADPRAFEVALGTLTRKGA